MGTVGTAKGMCSKIISDIHHMMSAKDREHIAWAGQVLLGSVALAHEQIRAQTVRHTTANVEWSKWLALGLRFTQPRTQSTALSTSQPSRSRDAADRARCFSCSAILVMLAAISELSNPTSDAFNLATDFRIVS